MLFTKYINFSVVLEFDTEEIQGHDYLDLSKPKKPKADINKLAGSLESFLNKN